MLNLEEIKNMPVYDYHHIDDPDCTIDPDTLLSDGMEKSSEEIAEIKAAVENRFKEAGWEGDGQLGLMWIPPFFIPGDETTWGTYIWHVKQSNNGTSFIGGIEFNKVGSSCNILNNKLL